LLKNKPPLPSSETDHFTGPAASVKLVISESNLAAASSEID
jgi:hypothetical protein